MSIYSEVLEISAGLASANTNDSLKQREFYYLSNLEFNLKKGARDFYKGLCVNQKVLLVLLIILLIICVILMAALMFYICI